MAGEVLTAGSASFDDMHYRAVETNLRHTMRFFALAKDCGETREMPGVSIVSSGIDCSVFNAAMLSTPVTGGLHDLERRISIAAVHFAARGLRWSYWVCEDLLDHDIRRRSRSVFLNHGLRSLVEPPGMYAERLLPVTRRLPDLEFRRVESDETRMSFCHVTSVAFELPYPISRQVYGGERPWKGDLTGYVGYLDGLPVVTGATVTAGGVVGVYSIGTLPGFQRQGCAEAMVRYALGKAREESGLERTALQATRSGFSLYERMGYRSVTNFVVYTSG